jgi:hypothetical protein
MYKQLNYKRLKLLGEAANPEMTLSEMAKFLGRSESGFWKALNAGSIRGDEVLKLADQWGMTTDDVFSFLAEEGDEVGEVKPLYMRRKKLADAPDALEWVRTAMSLSEEIDSMLEEHRKR